MTGVWGLVTVFFVMVYSSNLRQLLVVPKYEPEVNNEQDILDQGYKNIYTWEGDEMLPVYFFDMLLRFPNHYKMVGKTVSLEILKRNTKQLKV